jgi:hypothetical protein
MGVTAAHKLRLAGAALAAALLAGCGAGAASDAPDTARLTVSTDFGAREVRSVEAESVASGETVVGLTRAALDVTTGPGGAVRAIEGGGAGDWSLYVNGVAAAARDTLNPGDRVWWDRHERGAVPRASAVVGSFPEPFVRGLGGKRLPVRVECADPESPACEAVASRLVALGVPAARGGLRTSHVVQTLRVVVGPWAAARTTDTALQRMEDGPRISGVFARPSADGRRIALLDARGRTTRELGPGGGLIVAVRAARAAPTWAITGTGTAGVAAAARAFREGSLRDRFAVAVQDGGIVPLPAAAAR